MFVIGFLIGAVLGVFSAWRRKGNVLDMLQYAAGFGIAVGIIFMIGGVINARMNMG